MRGERHWQSLLHSQAEVTQAQGARWEMLQWRTWCGGPDAQKTWIEAGEWAGKCLCGVTPGAQQHLETGRTQRRLQRGAGRWSVRTTESSFMCHDVDALLQMQKFPCTEILCSPENQKTRTLQSIIFVLT